MAGASTAVIGVAFATNTAVIVLLQMAVVRRIDGRRRTRALAALGGLWAAAWLVLGLAGLMPGDRGGGRARGAACRLRARRPAALARHGRR